MAESNYSSFRFSYEKTGKYESPMKGSPLYQNKGSVFIDSLLVEAILTHTSLKAIYDIRSTIVYKKFSILYVSCRIHLHNPWRPAPMLTTSKNLPKKTFESL